MSDHPITVKDVAIRDVKAGENVTIMSPSNVYECSLGDNVFVGPFCEIQKGVHIGESTRIQSHSFICELVSIGRDCFIGHGVMFVNDRFATGGPARGDKTKWESTEIADRVSIGSNATILPVTICSDVVIGAGSVVTKSISKPGIYGGNPARLIRRLD
jgi:acetyltransferase-like isoleucine patch superfamily enzyme